MKFKNKQHVSVVGEDGIVANSGKEDWLKKGHGKTF